MKCDSNEKENLQSISSPHFGTETPWEDTKCVMVGIVNHGVCSLSEAGGRRQFKSRRLLLFPCNLQMPYHKTEFRELSVFFELSSHLLCSPHKYV